jgi:hypothetical protein
MEDFEYILEQFEDYTPDPSSMDQEPRNMYVAGGFLKAGKKLLSKTPEPKPTKKIWGLPLTEKSKPSILRREAVPLNLTQVNEISKNKEFEQAWKNYKISIRKVGRRKFNKDQFFEIWARENMAQGGRIGFKGGTDPKTGMGFQKGNTMGQSRDLKGKPSLNVEGKNQYITKTTEEIQAIIDANPDYITPKNFYQPTDKMKQKGSKKLLTLTDTQNPDVIFQKKGKDPADPEKQTARNNKRNESRTRQEGRKYKVTPPKGYQVHHMLPLAGNVDINTGDLAVISKKMNAKMSKYDKIINKLTTEASLLDFSKKNSLDRLDNINEQLNSVLKTIKKDLPKEYKGLIGFNKLTPVFDEYGTVLNLTSQPVGIDYTKSIAGSKGVPIRDVKTSDIQDLVNKAPKSKLNPKQEKMIKNLFCGNKKGGQPGTCDISEALDNMVRETNAVKNGKIKGAAANNVLKKAGKVARFGTGTGLGAVLGPWGIAGEAAFEIAMAVPGYGKGKSGKRLLGDSLLGLIPGVGQSSEEEFTEYATKDGMQDFEQQQIKDANRFLELNNSLGQLQNSGALEGKGAGRGNVGRAENLFFKQMDEYTPLYNQFVGAPPSESVSTVISEQDRINRQIAEAEAIRAQKRNIAGEEDFMAAEGGLANLMKKYYD